MCSIYCSYIKLSLSAGENANSLMLQCNSNCICSFRAYFKKKCNTCTMQSPVFQWFQQTPGILDTNHKFKVRNTLCTLLIAFVYSKTGLNSKHWGVLSPQNINIKPRQTNVSKEILIIFFYIDTIQYRRGFHNTSMHWHLLVFHDKDKKQFTTQDPTK